MCFLALRSYVRTTICATVGRSSVRPSHHSAATRCCRGGFAAVGPAGRRYRSIASWRSQQMQVVSRCQLTYEVDDSLVLQWDWQQSWNCILLTITVQPCKRLFTASLASSILGFLLNLLFSMLRDVWFHSFYANFLCPAMFRILQWSYMDHVFLKFRFHSVMFCIEALWIWAIHFVISELFRFNCFNFALTM